MDLDAMVKAYAETSLWSSHDYREDGTDDTLDVYGVDAIHPETMAKMRSDCESFLSLIEDEVGAEALAILTSDPEMAGHDFWLTRERHGAGFWDGDWPSHVSDGLTKWAQTFGSFDLWVDDSTGTYTIRHN